MAGLCPPDTAQTQTWTERVVQAARMTNRQRNVIRCGAVGGRPVAGVGSADLATRVSEQALNAVAVRSLIGDGVGQIDQPFQ